MDGERSTACYLGFDLKFKNITIYEETKVDEDKMVRLTKDHVVDGKKINADYLFTFAQFPRLQCVQLM